MLFECFVEFEDGDVFFIDLMYVVKIDGDVLWFYFDVVLSLKLGVVVYVYDIYFLYNMLFLVE